MREFLEDRCYQLTAILPLRRHGKTLKVDLPLHVFQPKSDAGLNRRGSHEAKLNLGILADLVLDQPLWIDDVGIEGPDRERRCRFETQRHKPIPKGKTAPPRLGRPAFS